MRTAIVSTKRGDTIELILENHGLRDAVELVIGSADVKRPKPTRRACCSCWNGWG